MVEAYCGPAPQPSQLLSAWNADVTALALCAMLIAAHVVSGSRSGRLALSLAVAVLLVLFVSPLCALTVSLFSARAVHHVLLVAVATPLLALAFPQHEAGKRLSLVWPVALHAGVLWLWHVPDVYAVAIAGALPYWAMQASLLGTAVLLWRRVLASGSLGAALLALLATVIQMGMLGALLTFAREPLYAPHFATTLPYGLTPLEDQQLAGLVMWVPAALPYVAAGLFLLAGRLGRQAGAAPA